MLVDAGCSISRNGRLRMPKRLVEAALNTAPNQFMLYDQEGNEALDLQGENCYYGTGSDTIFTIDPHTGRRRRTVLEDTGNFAKLVDGLENMDFVMSMSNPADMPIEDIYIHVLVEMIQNTNKPIIFIADGGRDIAKMYDIACLVAGAETEMRGHILPISGNTKSKEGWKQSYRPSRSPFANDNANTFSEVSLKCLPDILKGLKLDTINP